MRYRACLDVETLSVAPTAAVIGTGIVLRDYEKGLDISRSWFINRSLVIGDEDPDTLTWWSLQEEKENVFSGILTPREFCNEIIEFWKVFGLPEDTPIYADPATFDFPRLRHLFWTLERELPWSWRQEACSDSIVEFLREHGFEIPSAASTRPHHPEFDAIASLNQFDHCLDLFKRLRIGS